MRVRCLVFSFKGTNGTSSTTTASGCLSDRRSQTHSHTYILTDIILDETPHIYSDFKNFLLVCPTEAFLGKKNGIYVSVYMGNTDTKFVGVSSGVLPLVNHKKVDYAELFAKPARRPSRRKVSCTSSSRSTCCSFSPQRETLPPHPDQRHQHRRRCGGALKLWHHPAVRR